MSSTDGYFVLNMLLLVLASVLQGARAEIFTALAEMEYVLHAEQTIANDLRSYIQTEENRLTQLRQLADSFDSHSAEALKNPERHLGNPVNAFLLVKRFTTDWDNIVSTLIRTNTSEEFLDSISSQTVHFPEQDDLSGAANALLRLQDTYALSATTIAKGDLGAKVKNSPELTAVDCFELGRISYNSQDYYHTVLWMNEAVRIWEKEAAKSIDYPLLLDYLSYATYQQGNVWHALNLTHKWLSVEPNHIRAQNNQKYFEQLIKEEEELRKKGDDGLPPEPKNERPKDDYKRSEEFVLYERLCRGEETHVIKDKHKLTCQFRRHHPIFFYRPLKEEVMHLKPFIAIYHDVLTDTEIAKVKELATPRLQRATVQNPQTGQLETANYRVSKSSWLRDEEDPLIAGISLKSGVIANLSISTVEELQVVNYGIGGHYEPHYDFARKREKETFEKWRGNRIATVIYYMTDVASGGATVFPQIGVKLWPEKGSCAVWYNLLKSGDGDYDTRHAACPVLTGSKWVCNKWFHERGQEFTRPCAINPYL